MTVFLPPETPDICIPSVNKCQPNVTEELRNLCERGVANFITDTSSNITFWNQFCAACNGVNLTHSEPALSPDVG